MNFRVLSEPHAGGDAVQRRVRPIQIPQIRATIDSAYKNVCSVQRYYSPIDDLELSNLVALSLAELLLKDVDC